MTFCHTRLFISKAAVVPQQMAEHAKPCHCLFSCRVDFDSTHSTTVSACLRVLSCVTSLPFLSSGNSVKGFELSVGSDCRLQRIKDIAGPSGQDDAALDALMKGDFDPDQYDQQMAAAFGDDYYEVPFLLHTKPLALAAGLHTTFTGTKLKSLLFVVMRKFLHPCVVYAAEMYLYHAACVSCQYLGVCHTIRLD